MFFKTYGLLWQNARNLKYIKEYNNSFAKHLADSKLRTKDFLEKKSVKVAKTLFTLSTHLTIENFDFWELNPPFVIKPNSGFWWKWIIVIDSISSNGEYISNNKKSYTKKFIINHFKEIVDWFYSLSWKRDKVIIEKKLLIDKEIELLGKYWLPDIRVICFNMVPIMAMMRIPTKNSWWKANLHAGACWVWIDIWSWRLTYTTQFWKLINSAPGIWKLKDIKLPHWEEILKLAVKAQKVTNIWYLGCDIILDDDLGPCILELNIRPWLELQIANMAPLETRLRKIKWVYVSSIEKWVRLWRDLFSGDIEEKIKNISWKKVVWLKEYLSIRYKNRDHKYIADIKSSVEDNFIDRDFTIWVLKANDEIIESWYIKMQASILGEKRNLRFKIIDIKESSFIIWKWALRWFLLDPYKYKKWELPIDTESIVKFKKANTAINKSYLEQLKEIDYLLMKIDKKLKVLKYVNPINLKEEREKFINSSWEYLPNLVYPEIDLNFEDMRKKLDSIKIWDLPLSDIFKRKKIEIEKKIKLIESIKKSDSKWIYNNSRELYWDINKENLEIAIKVLENRKNIVMEKEYMTMKEIESLIKKFNHIYSIKIKLKERSGAARFAMQWNTLLVDKSAFVWKRELRSIIAHEIEWHYLRKYNWRKLDFEIFSAWTWWYLEIEEWIAIYNQSRFLSEKDKKTYSIYEKYYIMNYSINNSYDKLLNMLKEYYKEDYKKIFQTIIRLKRWFKNIKDKWFFAKDLVYLNWFIKVKDYIESTQDLKSLYIWKINLEDLEDIDETELLNIDKADLKIPMFL